MTNEQTAVMLLGYQSLLKKVWKPLSKMPVTCACGDDVDGAREVYDGVDKILSRLQNDILLLSSDATPVLSEDRKNG